eukprot:TRINITY_DN1404_c0_g2_i1.p1 TRINITY_DN1404_c0_g2~~TRINITY_DN1404_c0_g2_i1.p1  ORF type:complete len:127 (-),score=23.63 TRINITY_DN1404_c0_g2_i1:117-497(-)
MTDAEQYKSQEPQNCELTDRSLSLADFLQMVKLHMEETPEPQERSLSSPDAFTQSQEDDSDSDDEGTYAPPQRSQGFTPQTIAAEAVAATEVSRVLQGTENARSMLEKRAAFKLEARILTTRHSFP